MLRRLRQVKNIFMVQPIKNYEINHIKLSQRYNESKEVEYYSKLADEGLYEHEETFFKQQLKYLPKSSQILIVGGGCGREAFALKKMGFKTDVLDISSSMIQQGRRIALQKNQDVHFYYSSLETFSADKKYSYIYICASLLNFIQNQKRRTLFLRKAHDLLHNDGSIGLEADVFEYRKLHRYNLASKILKWKLGKDWEKGDTLRSFYGNHNTNEQTLFYHFYQTPKELITELKNSGFTNTNHHDDFFFGEK